MDTKLYIAASVTGFLFVSASSWALISLLALWVENEHGNRSIKDVRGPHPDDVQNASSLGGQLVLINAINLMTGATAGVGASLFVNDGKLQWPAGLGISLIMGALAITEVTGIFVAYYVSRPTHAWISNTNIFRSYLTQVIASGTITNEVVKDIAAARDKWSSETIVRPLSTSRELRELGLELSSAKLEWSSPFLSDRVKFGKKLRGQISRRQVWQWIGRKRIWRLGIPPAISACSLATLTAVVTGWQGDRVPETLGFLVLLTSPWATLLYTAAFFIARRDLVMTNRYFALERKQFNDCVQLIDKIIRKQPEEISRDDNRLTIQIGRWDIRLRHHKRQFG